MNSTINIKEIASNFIGAKNVEPCDITIRLVIDETAPADISSVVRDIFTSSATNLRLSISYLQEGNIPISASDDAVILVAGFDERVGQVSKYVRSMGVPCAIVTTMPSLVDEIANNSGYAIPAGDIVSANSAVRVNPKYLISYLANKMHLVDKNQLANEPIELDEKTINATNSAIASWLRSVCKSKADSLASTLPNLRKSITQDYIDATSIENAGIGFVELIPGADMPVMTANQIKMVIQIAMSYGQEINKDRIKEIAVVIASGFFLRGTARKVLNYVPFCKFVFKGVIAYAATYAIGMVTQKYFEDGGGIPGLDNALKYSTKSVFAATVSAITKGKQIVG